MIIIDLIIGFFVEEVTWTQSVGPYKKKWPSYKSETQRIIRIIKIGTVSQTQLVNIFSDGSSPLCIYNKSNEMWETVAYTTNFFIELKVQ